MHGDLLLERLRGVENRTARFVCVIALVRDGKLVKTFRGAVEGRILDEARGSGGFGAAGRSILFATRIVGRPATSNAALRSSAWNPAVAS